MTSVLPIKSFADIPKAVTVVNCAACERRQATRFVAITVEINAFMRTRFKQMQMPLCDGCGDQVEESVASGGKMAKKLAGVR